jgi:PAS domain S-box-containing protein
MPASAILEALPEPVIVTDLRGQVLRWNPAAEQLLGWSAADAVGHNWLELGISLAASAEIQELTRSVRHGKTWEGSFPITSRQGRTLLARFRAAPLWADNDGVSEGSVVGIVATASDLLGPRYAQQRTAMRVTLLSRAGMLLGTSLDTGRTLAAIAELLVPSFADHCVVDLLDEAQRLCRAVTVHADDPLPASARAGHLDESSGVLGDPVDYPPEHPCARALATGRPAIARGTALRERYAGDPDTERMLALNAHALIAVPLLGPSGVKGVLAVAASDGQRDYDASDIELLEELAARAGLALENASLYDRERRLALTLQHSLLPETLPVIDGLEIAVGYDPAAESVVGGDVYDVVPLSAGRVGIVIGDVQGRGPHAAAVMGQLRAALRALALIDMEPAQLLSKLDELVRGLNEALLVTCVYAVYDPFTRRCILANAGHPPPLLAGVDGCFPMEVPPDVPLGVGGVTFHDHVFTVPPGDTVVLYTDGVVERRDQPVDQGVRALCATLEELPRDPRLVCRATLRAAAGPADDDEAVLAMRTSEADLPMSQLVLPGRAEAVSTARQHTREVLTSWGLHAPIEQAELLVSELVTNAVRHAAKPHPQQKTTFSDDDELDAFLDQFLDPYEPENAEAVDGELVAAHAGGDGLAGGTPAPGLIDELKLLDEPPGPDPSRRIELTLRRGENALWIEVYDPDVRLPRLRMATENDEGGRGLYLVETLSRRWGARQTRTGKLVWFELPLS